MHSFNDYRKVLSMSKWSMYGFSGEAFLEIPRDALGVTTDRDLDINLPLALTMARASSLSLPPPGGAKQLAYGCTNITGCHINSAIVPLYLGYEKYSG